MSRFSIDWSELSLQVMITFGHFLWQACVVGVVLLVVQHVAESLRDSRTLLRLRRKSVSLGETDLRGASLRYTIACVAFFLLPVCVIATFAWVHQSRGPIVLVARRPVESPSTPAVSANDAIPTMANTGIPVLPPSATPINAEVPVTKPFEPPTLVVEPQTSPVQRIQAFAPYLLLAYIVGVGFMLARFLLSIIGSSRLRRTVQPITDVKLLRTIAEQCARVGLKRIPIVALCQRVSVPVVVGIVKPMILLPPTLLCGLDPNQIAAILSHEIAHIRRYDLIVNLLQRIVEALLFFHPVTWWISRRVSIERENCCDDVAADCMGRLPYAGALLQMAELCIGNDRRRSAALATLAASGGNSTDLGYRIRRLIGTEETTRVGFTRRSVVAGLALISLLTISLFAWGQSHETEQKAVVSAAENPANSQDTGALTGKITLDGVVPLLPKLRVRTPASPWLTKLATDEEQKKYEASLVEIDDESIQVDADQGLVNAFVFVAKAPSNWQSPKEDLKPFTLKMHDDRFAPRAAIVRTGQDVRLNNSSADADNFAFESMKNDGQNRAIGAGSEIILEHPFTIPERIPIQAKSRMHPWKTTFLLPLDHPFAAITDSHGKFTIEGLPPGEHPFLVWHERTGWLEEPLIVNIEAGQTTEVNRSYNVDRLRLTANQNPRNSNWITAPQICVGKAYSETAKATNWNWDQERRALLATPENGEMLASVLPGVDADFVVTVSLQFIDDAWCRLIVGETTCDVSQSTQHTKIIIGEKEHNFLNDDKADEWTLLQIKRRNNLLSVQVDKHSSINLGSMASEIPRISLKSSRGTIAVKNFVVTGNVQKVNQDRAARINAVRLLPDRIASSNDSQSSDEKSVSNKQSVKLIDGETGKPLLGLTCRVIIAKRNSPQRYRECTTDESGVVEVDVSDGELAWIAEVPSGWFSNDFGSVFVVAVSESVQQPQGNIEKQDKEPKVLKLWRGTEVDGRLLWPDRTPAAGVKLTAGVYINNQAWKEKLGMDLTHYSFDHGDWPNWSRTIVTDDDGKFRVTVPPKNARLWLRIGTTQLGFGPQINGGENDAITQRLAKCVPLEIQYGGNSRSNMLIVHDIAENDDMFLHAGDLQLETGVIVQGRVIDTEGKGLSNVHLTTTGPHGPHSGRSATSDEDGKFEFPAMAAGNLTVHPDARLRDLAQPIPEQVISRDVQAVFVDQSFTIPAAIVPHQITIRAVPHTEVTFEWVDRRADKTQPIAFYGAFRVRGYMPDENGKPATYWTSETERVERDGKQWLAVKIPTQLLKPELMLVADSKVTASYSDSTGVTSGPGIVELGDITAIKTRTISGDVVTVKEVSDIKPIAEKLTASMQSWKLAHVDEKPSVDIDGFQGFRIVLRRTWKEFTSPPQSAAIGVDQGPFEMRSEDWEFVLLPCETKQVPTELRSQLPWQKSNSPYHTRDVCLGEGCDYLWFTRGTIFGQETVRDRLQLQGGDDRFQLLIDGIQVDDAGTNTSNTCLYQISQYGDRALPYIQKAVESTQLSEMKVRVVRSLGLITTDASSELLLKYYESSNPDIQRGAQYALLHRPFRKAAKRAYLDMLTRHTSVDSASAACAENKWTEAVPILKEIELHPESLGELQIVYSARRILEANPIPKSLLEASEVIFQSRPSDPVDEGSVIGNAVKLLIESSDHQAVILLALKMATYSTKATFEHIRAIRAHGTAILKSQKSAEAVFFMTRVLDSLPPRERDQILQHINPLTTLHNPASSLTPALSPYQPRHAVSIRPEPAAKAVPTGPRKLVATIFGTTVYVDQLDPSLELKAEFGKLPQDQAAAKCLDLEGETLLRMISRRAIEDYVRREQIEITAEMSNRLFEIAKTKELSANPDSTMSEDSRRAGLLFMMRGSLMDWLVCKSLYEKYGGRVGMGSLGLWIAVDGRNELMREYLKKGSIVISDAEIEKAFWKAANKPNFADAYPQGDQLKLLMSHPPFFTEPLNDSR